MVLASWTAVDNALSRMTVFSSTSVANEKISRKLTQQPVYHFKKRKREKKESNNIKCIKW